MGEIVLSARHTRSEVIIEIRMTARASTMTPYSQGHPQNGIACRTGIVHREILNFLMAPGFSTNTEVTEYSGRGVGMDVVKRNVEDVGGTVVITSDPGRNDHHAEDPLTMAIMDGMEVSGQVPPSSPFPSRTSASPSRSTTPTLIHDARGSSSNAWAVFILLSGCGPLPAGGGMPPDQRRILIWLEAGELSYCLFVDELLGEQQVVEASAQLSSTASTSSRAASCWMHDPGGWQHQHHLGYLQPLHPCLTHFY